MTGDRMPAIVRYVTGSGANLSTPGVAHRGFGYPVAWLLPVEFCALAYGIALGFMAPVPSVLVWVVVPAAGFVLGLIGGLVFARVKDLAALGAAMFAGVFVVVVAFVSGGGSISEHDQGQLGITIAVIFVITFILMLVGAQLGTSGRRLPRYLSAGKADKTFRGRTGGDRRRHAEPTQG